MNQWESSASSPYDMNSSGNRFSYLSSNSANSSNNQNMDSSSTSALLLLLKKFSNTNKNSQNVDWEKSETPDSLFKRPKSEKKDSIQPKEQSSEDLWQGLLIGDSDVSNVEDSDTDNDNDSGNGSDNNDDFDFLDFVPPPERRRVIADLQHSAYWGDPHVADADRPQQNAAINNFTVTGPGTYNLLKDKGIELNATHKKYNTWAIEVTDKIALNLPNVNLSLHSNGTLLLNGKPFTGTQTLENGVKLSFNGTKLTVNTGTGGEYDLEFNIRTTGHLNADGGAVSYLDTQVVSRERGVFSDGEMPTGILGEGFDEDGQVRTRLKHGIETYRVSD